MVNHWEAHRSRRPVRSTVAETVITTALASMAVIALSLLLIHTLACA
ncbi:hypothetical protein ABZ916_09425 [Streptomyces sp. NPDC046853]